MHCPDNLRHRRCHILIHAACRCCIGEQDEAISVLNDAINTSPNAINKLNGMRRVARYREKRYEPEAGLTAWRELEQYANSIGKEGSKPARKARSKIEQLERTLGLRP